MSNMPEFTADDKLYSVDEAAQRVGYSRSQAYAEVRRGKLKARNLAGRLIVTEAAIVEYINTYAEPVQPRKRNRL